MDSPSSAAAPPPAAAASAADPPSPAPSSPSLAASSTSSPDPSNPSPSSPTSSPAAADAAAAPSAAPPSSSHRRVPPPCWSTEETIALIDAYQDKWYSLRRGNLRASDWQDVADAVAARGPRRLAPPATAAAAASAANPLSSSASPSGPKTAVQCRHKVEKLRKRYRAERQRSLKRNPRAPPKSSWEFFRKMHAMETGGPPPQGANKGGGGTGGSGPHGRRAPGAGAGPSPSPLPSSSGGSASDDDDDDENHHNLHRYRHTRPINGLMMMTNPKGPASSASRHGNASAAPPPMAATGFRFKVPKAVRTKLLSPRGEAAMSARHQNSTRPFGGEPRHHIPTPNGGFMEMRNRLLDKKKRKHHLAQMGNGTDNGNDHRQVSSGDGDGDGGMGEVADAVRMLGDGFLKLEQMKMDQAMQIHRLRMETEMKRTQMMLESNRKIMDMMLGGSTGASNKRAKASS